MGGAVYLGGGPLYWGVYVDAYDRRKCMQKPRQRFGGSCSFFEPLNCSLRFSTPAHSTLLRVEKGSKKGSKNMFSAVLKERKTVCFFSRVSFSYSFRCGAKYHTILTLALAVRGCLSFRFYNMGNNSKGRNPQIGERDHPEFSRKSGPKNNLHPLPTFHMTGARPGDARMPWTRRRNGQESTSV